MPSGRSIIDVSPIYCRHHTIRSKLFFKMTHEANSLKGLSGEPIATSSIRSYNWPLNWKTWLVLAISRSLATWFFSFPSSKSYVGLNESLPNTLSTKMLIASFTGILVKRAIDTNMPSSLMGTVRNERDRGLCTHLQIVVLAFFPAIWRGCKCKSCLQIEQALH